MLLKRMWFLLLVLALVATGCATGSFKREAFGKGKRFAIVTVCASPDIGNMSSNSTGGGTLLGGIKALSKDSGYSNSSKDVFKETLPLILKQFGDSGKFKLIPHETVAKSKTYSQAQADEPKVFFTRLEVADRYKYFKDNGKLSKLAKGLNADGAVFISATYGYTFSGVGAAGLIAAGKHRANVMISVYAVDEKGEVVWADTVNEDSDDGIGTIGESVNFKKLNPLLVKTTEKAAKKLIANLKERI